MANLILNPSFEVGTLGAVPTNWTESGNEGGTGGTSTGTVEDGTAFDLSRYYRIKIGPLAGQVNKNKGALSDQSGVGTVTPASSYQLSAWARAARLLQGCTGGLTIYWYDAAGSYISASAATFTPTREWYPYTLTATAPANASRISVYLSGQGLDYGDVGWLDFEGVYFDAISTLPTFCSIDSLAAKIADLNSGLAAVREATGAAVAALATAHRFEDGTWTRVGTMLSPDVAWEGVNLCEPCVVKDGATWKMWYHGGVAAASQIGYATASNPAGPWTKYASNPVLASYRYPHVIKDGSTYRMWAGNLAGNMDYLTSSDGLAWTLVSTAIITPGSGAAFDSVVVANMCVWQDGATWYMLYEGRRTGDNYYTIGLATAANPQGPWAKFAGNPVISGPREGWCASHPDVVKVKDRLICYFHGGWSSTLPNDLCRAVATDPYRWSVDARPMLTRSGAGEGQGTTLGQLADSSVVIDSGTIHHYHCITADGNAGPWSIALATAPVEDAYAVVANADYGNAKLVRATTPANTMAVDASGNVTAGNMRGTDNAQTAAQAATDKAALLAAIDADVPTGWVTITHDSWPDDVEHTTANKLGPVKVNGVTRAGVLAEAIGSDLASTNSTTTDASGEFTLPVPAGDTYTVRFCYDGAISESVEVTL